MKWDVDKLLVTMEVVVKDDLHTHGIGNNNYHPATSIHRSVSHLDFAEQYLGKLTTKEKEDGFVLHWTLVLGKGPKRLYFHGRTIHEAYLNARKVLKKLSDDDLKSLGLARPKKRSNSYAQARRKKKAK